MPFTIRGQLTGQASVFGAFDGLKRGLRNRILRYAVRDAAKVVLDAARRAVPDVTGAYRKSLAVKVKTYRDSDVTVAIVGPRSGYSKTATVQGPRGSYKVVRKPVYYAHLVEFGVRPHALGGGSKLGRKTRKGVTAVVQRGAQHPGFAGRKPLTRSWEATKGRAAEVLRARVAAEIKKL